MLDGLPNLLDLGKLKIGENVIEMFTCDLSTKRTISKLFKKSNYSMLGFKKLCLQGDFA